MREAIQWDRDSGLERKSETPTTDLWSGEPVKATWARPFAAAVLTDKAVARPTLALSHRPIIESSGLVSPDW